MDPFRKAFNSIFLLIILSQYFVGSFILYQNAEVTFGGQVELRWLPEADSLPEFQWKGTQSDQVFKLKVTSFDEHDKKIKPYVLEVDQLSQGQWKILNLKPDQHIRLDPQGRSWIEVDCLDHIK